MDWMEMVILYINRSMASTVMIATLRQPNVREHLENIKETLDVLVMKAFFRVEETCMKQ